MSPLIVMKRYLSKMSDLNSNKDEQVCSSVGLALSGGGFRAASFHVGVLKRLEELEILDQIKLVSTVSGGSITGALHALNCVNFGNGSPGGSSIDLLFDQVTQIVSQNFRGKALFGTPRRAFISLGSFVYSGLSRASLLAQELDRQAYSQVTLDMLPDWVLINATNLATGKSWKFFNDKAGDFLVGATSQTHQIKISEAVTASAAYPILTNPYQFKTSWKDMDIELLDDRWSRPPASFPNGAKSWRKAHSGELDSVVFPLADGGMYDNEGLNGLRSARIQNIIYASTTTPHDYYSGAKGPKSLMRMIEVLHDRLGAVTRQHAHEMTHRQDPTSLGVSLSTIAFELDGYANLLSLENDKMVDSKVNLSKRLKEISASLTRFSGVGFPPRGHQYRSIAPILLHRKDLSRNLANQYDDPIETPVHLRGIDESLVDDLARVRTDLDAYAPEVVELLIAQAYFLTDYNLRIGMPNLFKKDGKNVASASDAGWKWAIDVISRANDCLATTKEILISAADRKLFGHS